VVDVTSLKKQLAELATCSPTARIDLREPILAHGVAAIGPLADLALSEPDLGPAVVAWLEVLANRDEEARTPVATALRGLLVSPREETRRHATEALARLGSPVSAAQARRAAAARA
jgi:hypothetical protein